MGGEDGDKIVRDSGNITIKLTAEEEKYRAKYLPDPAKLTDEKLVCTVCSASLSSDVHKGQTIYVHRALKVLVCLDCFTFYGDGCFSTDEDGDDKYCRWCGQGGTLFLCSTCNCAFCQKCVKQNLKASVLADLEKDDWKCYFCNPRPLFGCRTICWGALELNKIGIEKEKEKLKKQKERLEKMEARKREREENLNKLKKFESGSEDEQLTKKRKSRVKNSDSSSDEVMPAKKTRSLGGREKGHMNGSIGVRRRRKDSSSDSDYSNNRRTRSRNQNKSTKKRADTSSEDESDEKSKNKAKFKKKKSKDSSDSSNEDKKSKRKSGKKKQDSSDDESSDEKPVRKKKLARRKKNESGSSSDNKPKKKSFKKNKKDTSDEEISNDDHSKKLKKNFKKKNQAEDSSDKTDDNSKTDKKKFTETKKRNDESDNDLKKEQKNVLDKSEEMKSKVNDTTSENAIIRKRIKLAILWLSNAVKDISELGTLISIRSTKFGKKKINAENLKTYDDVLNAVSKLKQLMSGIHSNYDHLEKGLDAQLKPWKILTGLEEPEKDKSVAEETATSDVLTAKSDEAVTEKAMPADEDICDKNERGSSPHTVNSESNIKKEGENNEIDDMVLQWSGLSADEDSGGEKTTTKDLIRKAHETLEDERDEETKKNANSSNEKADKTGEDNSDGALNPSQNSTTINESELSESVINQSQDDLKDDAQTPRENSDEEKILEEKQDQEENNISIKTEVSESSSDTDMNNTKASSTKDNINSGDENESHTEKRNGSNVQKSAESASKRKSESKGQ